MKGEQSAKAINSAGKADGEATPTTEASWPKGHMVVRFRPEVSPVSAPVGYAALSTYIMLHAIASHPKQADFCSPTEHQELESLLHTYVCCEGDGNRESAETLQPMHAHTHAVTQSCLKLCHPMDCSLPGFSVHRIIQAIILECIAICYSKGSSRSRD